jgi:hypothetical protein
MLFIGRAREESVLPKMSASTMCSVDVLGVEQMRLSQGIGEAIHCSGGGNQVNMVRHQAIGLDGQTMALPLLVQYLQIGPAIPVAEEHVLLVVPSLSDVMRTPRNDYSCGSRHECVAYEQ